MAERAVTRAFYDALADVYEYLFDDFEGEEDHQGAVLDSMFSKRDWVGSCIIDPAAGIGTQALPLARRGWCVHASDASPRAVQRIRSRAPEASIVVADVRDFAEPSQWTAHSDHAVILLAGNSIAFIDDLSLLTGLSSLQNAAGRTSVVGSTRIYPTAAAGDVTETTQTIIDRLGRRTVTHRWRWIDEQRYDVDVAIVGKVSFAGTAPAYARSRADIESLLRCAGWCHLEWVEPDVSGFYQPLYVAW